ncbi:fibro-slime domain-containing protein [Fibrobacter intestinalis]|uniref:Fibro-slime domain-containing protein n=1 Tax=Fibrobacter intestinalis TaxID=28122 RepID=A0A1M6SVC7_9BACT|nr:fibro-slime domain-containing protein [Fibrobacter intestinalis]SHK48653.1 fibro-slime domain-containing protein [Fibrobacter intestinalis]
MKENGKHVKSWLAKAVFGCSLLLGAAQTWALSCSGNIYVADPGWSSFQMVVDGGFNLIPSTSLSDGWYVIKANSVGSQYAKDFFFAASDWNGFGITKSQYNVTGWNQNDKISCSDFGTSESLYIYEDPTTAGKTAVSTEPPDAKYFYFLPPDDQLWNSSIPMLSTDGGKTGVAMSTDPTRCGWFYYVWFNQEVPASITIYRDSDTERGELIGWDGYDGAGDAPTAIPMNDLFSSFSTNMIFFMSDPSMWPDDFPEADKGFAVTDPMVDGNCEYHLAAIIYDSDASLHPAFSCYSVGGEGCQYGVQGVSADQAQAAVNACIGVTHGIVQDTLGPDKKPLLKTTAMGGMGETCFISEAFFNQLFHPTTGVNEMTCFDLPFNRDSYGKWEFNSDYYTSKGLTAQGGFYPTEQTTDADVLTSYGSSPLPAARTKRGAEGPVFVGPLLREVDPVENAQKFDLLCNGAGWLGGMDDCSGRFANGDDDIAAVNSWLGATDACMWGWSCQDSRPAGWPSFKDGTDTPLEGGTYRWTSTRNQQFCFESHAQFVYKPGLRFNFRGDDDIWVFIGGKLAVDLGGTHLAAPGYAVLDNLTDKNGNSFVEGETYDLDIFFCDRRTTMSNVRINTNMYIQQNTGISRTKDTSYVGEGDRYNICYEETGAGDCAAALSGASGTETKVYCNDAMAGIVTLTYALYKGSSPYTTASGTTLDESYFASAYASGQKVFFGAIDFSSSWYQPVINKAAVAGLPSGTYKLIAAVNGKKTTVATIRVAGTLDVLTENGQDSTGHIYKVVTSAMAGVRIPVFVGAIGDALENGNLDVDLEGAVDERYTPSFDDGLMVFADSSSQTPLTSSDIQTVGARGIDTLWATVPLAAMTSSSITKSIWVRNKKLALTFTLPAIAFVDSTYSEQINPPYGNWNISEDSILYRGAEYKAYIIMFDPTTGTPCTSCSYGLVVDPAQSSEGLTGTSLEMVEGKAEIRFRSSKRYPDELTLDSAFITVTTTENSLIFATYRGLVFTEPPVPLPDSVMVFDAKGEPKTYAGLDQNFTRDEYLDGIADSLWISYHRPFKLDSLPDSIIVTWSLDSTEAVTLSRSQIEAAAKLLPSGDLYDSVLAFSGLSLSSEVQTTHSGAMVHSWASFKKNGVVAHQGFSKTVEDKVAPIITRGTISEMSEGLFQVRVTFSEPVVSAESDIKSLFMYYLRSATDLVGSAKYTEVTATNANIVDSNVTMFFNASLGSIPQSGDFVRAKPGILTDANGNGLTDYDVVVPSPWMLLEGDAQSTIASIKMGTVNSEADLKAPPVQTYFLGIYDSVGTLLEKYPNTLGYIIKTDMGNILTDPKLDSLIAAGKVSIDDVKLHYELDIFTNLGTFVVHKKGSIACSDQEFFGGDCRNNRGYVYVAWDMVTSKGRLAGTGAYIAKLSTHATIPTQGKKGKHNVTEVWGVRRTTK